MRKLFVVTVTSLLVASCSQGAVTPESESVPSTAVSDSQDPSSNDDGSETVAPVKNATIFTAVGDWTESKLSWWNASYPIQVEGDLPEGATVAVKVQNGYPDATNQCLYEGESLSGSSSVTKEFSSLDYLGEISIDPSIWSPATGSQRYGAVNCMITVTVAGQELPREDIQFSNPPSNQLFYEATIESPTAGTTLDRGDGYVPILLQTNTHEGIQYAVRLTSDQRGYQLSSECELENSGYVSANGDGVITTGIRAKADSIRGGDCWVTFQPRNSPTQKCYFSDRTLGTPCTTWSTTPKVQLMVSVSKPSNDVWLCDSTNYSCSSPGVDPADMNAGLYKTIWFFRTNEGTPSVTVDTPDTCSFTPRIAAFWPDLNGLADGECTFTVTVPETQNRLAASSSYSFNVLDSRPVLTFTVNDISVRRGEEFEPAIEVSGLAENDAVGTYAVSYLGVDGTEYGPSAEAPSEAGRYVISTSDLTLSAGDLDGYKVRYAEAELQIGTIDISVSVDDFEVDAGVAVQPTVSITGEPLAGDEFGDVTLTYEGIEGTEYGPSSEVPTGAGVYRITPSELILVTGAANDYSIEYSSAVMSIGVRRLELTANRLDVTEGESIEVSYSLTGELLGEDVLGEVVYEYEGIDGTSYGPTTDVPTVAGTYSVTPTSLTLVSGDLADYSVTYTSGTLVIAGPEEDVETAEPMLLASGETPQEAPGSGSYLLDDGSVVPVPVKVEDEVLTAGYEQDILMELEGRDDDSAVETAEGNLLFFQEKYGEVSGYGFKPNSTVEIWVFSTPFFLGTAEVDENGTFVREFKVPADLAEGEHTIQAEGITVLDKAKAVSAGVEVQALPNVLPATGRDTSRKAALATFVLLLGTILTMSVSRRRYEI